LGFPVVRQHLYDLLFYVPRSRRAASASARQPVFQPPETHGTRSARAAGQTREVIP